MKEKIEFKAFNASHVPLEGSNLIEASAGTGKTYSIAILTLRLILEKKLSIKEILMVTFTKAAVAELEERIRLFIRQGYKVSQGELIKDPTITALVENAIACSDQDSVASCLNEAVLFLDETSVLTIHSFCQQSLNEFAFETGQLFGADLLQDTSALLEEEINSFWRKQVTSIPTELLGYLQQAGLSRNAINSVVREHLAGKRYFIYDAKRTYDYSESAYAELMTDLLEIKEREASMMDDLIQQVSLNAVQLRTISEGNSFARKANLSALVDHPAKFLALLWEGKNKQYIQKIFPEILERLEGYHALALERDAIVQEVNRNLNCWVINQASKGINTHKQLHNQLSYDDLIVKLHEALVKRENPELEACLQQKYKAVFIDEFQDTDRMQYEIFEKAFGSQSILFYIGDPKQSIYAWRKADIFTYFKAQQAVDHLYGMNQNYRSSAPFIKAMNLFFKPNEAFDTFYFQQASSRIDYIKVESPLPNTKGNLFLGEDVDVPMSITECDRKSAIVDAVVGQVIELISSADYFIEEKGIKRPVKPTDIGILVRGNQEGKDIKNGLAKFRIPAVTISDAKVLQTEEARYLLYLLEAILGISIASINKALLSPFTGFKEHIILSLDDEKTIALFRKYKVLWEKEGIYAALNGFIHDFNVKKTLLAQHSESGERVVTNLYQLIELLHKMQSTKKLSPLELIGWLKRGIEGNEQVGDEFEQRIESDEESIKIVTLHKSKGLEYNIVLAPFLDLLTGGMHATASFRDSESGEYVSIEKSRLNDEQQSEYIRQLEQENRRLIYVALTRAVYKCFLYRNLTNVGVYKYRTSSSLVPFVTACKDLSVDLISFKEAVQIPSGYVYSQDDQMPLVPIPSGVQFKLLQPNWRKMSYSMLRAEHERSVKNKSNSYQSDYDQFIFSQLTKGAKTGNMLHFIFENIVFNSQGRWDFAIKNAVQQYAPLREEIYTPMLKEMLDHVLNASIVAQGEVFKLSELGMNQSIHELEFDFTVSPFQVDQLKGLSDDRIEIDVNYYHELEGVMNGMIDLFFEYHGKYYVLDWKSNYLGDSLADYSADRLAMAMNENNYHLQYLIYTLATKKYLESRLLSFDYETQFGGVIYLFVRGIRKGADSGIFTAKPSLEKMKQLDRILAMPDFG